MHKVREHRTMHYNIASKLSAVTRILSDSVVL